jgi:hypothetical protein
MIKDFFIKKENVLISVIALVSIFCVVLGFLFLFFKSSSTTGPKVIPNTAADIQWETFSSKILDTKIQYPDYLYIEEQKESNGVGVTIAEFKPREFLTYFSNQNHVSFYPDGIDNQLFYGKTKQSEFTSATGQVFKQTEYLTADNKVWAVMLVPVVTPKMWQARGFIWIQTALKNKTIKCVSKAGEIIEDEVCDPYMDQLPVYNGEISGQFLKFGYEIVNKNTF